MNNKVSGINIAQTYFIRASLNIVQEHLPSKQLANFIKL